jgi:transcriptional regulator CtsR
MLSDDIERFIKGMLSEGEMQVELQRNELAQHFGCAPSQINYVRATRFTLDHGYVIESRRGGGGYVRVVRVALGGAGAMLSELIGHIGSAISREQAVAILRGLYERGIIDGRVAQVMRSAVDAPMLSGGAKDFVRAGILRNMLQALLVYEAKEVEAP